MEIYLDYAATTPLDARVLDLMLPYLTGEFANPSSLHAPGRRARRAVETAREQVAAAIGAKPREIIFLSGATEADNHALRGLSKLYPGSHIITSALEHSAVLTTCKGLEREGHPLTYLLPNEAGEITPEMVQEALREDTALVALMHVNNETGAITDIAAVAEVVREAGVLLFCDAVQSFGVLPVDVDALGVDLLSLSAHKIYGPKGAGVLYVRAPLTLPPLLSGGEQERGFRAGTLNVPAIVGMGAAAEHAAHEQEVYYQFLAGLQAQLERRLQELPGIRLNAAGAKRAPKHVNVRVLGADGEALLMNLDALGVYASAGSACSAGTLEPSHVLLSMGLSRQEAKASIRFSLGRGLNAARLDETVSRLSQAAEMSQPV